MSEVNPNLDPIAKLSKFTPAGGPDAAELLFAAGRASARTPWGWKAAVAALVASNLALGAVLAFRTREVPPSPHPDPVPVVQPQPELPAPAPPSSPAPTDDPSSYRTLWHTDLDRAPKADPVSNAAPREPLTVLSGRRGDID